jgi:hypothetical protein
MSNDIQETTMTSGGNRIAIRGSRVHVLAPMSSDSVYSSDSLDDCLRFIQHNGDRLDELAELISNE